MATVHTHRLHRIRELKRKITELEAKGKRPDKIAPFVKLLRKLEKEKP